MYINKYIIKQKNRVRSAHPVGLPRGTDGFRTLFRFDSRSVRTEIIFDQNIQSEVAGLNLGVEIVFLATICHDESVRSIEPIPRNSYDGDEIGPVADLPPKELATTVPNPCICSQVLRVDVVVVRSRVRDGCEFTDEELVGGSVNRNRNRFTNTDPTFASSHGKRIQADRSDSVRYQLRLQYVRGLRLGVDCNLTRPEAECNFTDDLVGCTRLDQHQTSMLVVECSIPERYHQNETVGDSAVGVTKRPFPRHHIGHFFLVARGLGLGQSHRPGRLVRSIVEPQLTLVITRV